MGKNLSSICHLSGSAFSIIVLLTSCADFKPKRPARADQMQDSPGIFSGESGEFVFSFGGTVETGAPESANEPDLALPPSPDAPAQSEARTTQLPPADPFPTVERPTIMVDPAPGRRPPLIIPEHDLTLPPPP